MAKFAEFWNRLEALRGQWLILFTDFFFRLLDIVIASHNEAPQKNLTGYFLEEFPPLARDNIEANDDLYSSSGTIPKGLCSPFSISW